MDMDREPILDRKSLFLRASRSQPVERVPVWMMRQAGRYLPEYRAIRARHPFLEVCKTPDLAAEVSLQPFQILGVDAVIVFSDILIPAEAMGLPLELGDAGPVLPQPVRAARDVETLREFDPETETRFVGDAIRKICGAVGPTVPVLGFAGAPWTLACYMIEGKSTDGFPAARQMLYAEPRLLQILLDKISKSTVAYLRAQIAAGATAVQLFDTWAGELSLPQYDAFALPATQKLISELNAGQTPIIYYAKAASHLLQSLAKTGADVLSVGWRVDLAASRPGGIGTGVALQGNIDPCLLLGPVERIQQAVRAAIAQTGGVGHILNLGHGILPQTPVENARAFVRAGQSIALSAPVSVAQKG